MPAIFKFCTRRRNAEINTDHHTGKRSVLGNTSGFAETGGFRVIGAKRLSCWKMNK